MKKRDKRFSITSKRSKEDNVTFELISSGSGSSVERISKKKLNFEIKTNIRDPNETFATIHSPKSRQ